MIKRIARFTALAFALIAVSLLLVQPICEAGELRQPQLASHATAPGADGDSCCSILAAAPLPAATTAGERPNVAVAEPTAGAPAVRPKIVSRTLASAEPLLVPRYYARSARIQR